MMDLTSSTYKVIQEEVEVDGYICGDSQKAAVWRPDVSLGKFPLISFAHGWHNGGDDIHNYDDLLTGIAAAGYIVIGNLSAYDRYCLKETKDQIHTIEWASTSKEYQSKIDWTVKVGILGHSMGGEATHNTATNSDAINKWKIGAAVALHPVYTTEQPIKVPILFGSGSIDMAVPSASVK